ncbi:uncharacterized protein LOC116213998 [Punica granatum]|uniref:Uncharacterized protein LOC116213998 n=1 Tax=Punica granatum TaxID=22663 RepID=A0A6P8EEW9_PUNGR|nr:uncharacterized protein LOC116213998 [Punica granatum]
MRVKSKPVSSLNQQSFSCSSSPRTRKKHKRLDAICENTYKENHGGSSEGTAKGGDAIDDSDLRRSKRARRAPVILDASPPPPRKRRILNKIGKASSGKKGEFLSPRGEANEEDNLVDVEETPESWKSRLRTRGRRRVSFRREEKVDSPRRKRRLFRDVNEEEKEEQVAERHILDDEKGESDEDTAKLEVGSSLPLEKKTAGKVKAAAFPGIEENVGKLKLRRPMRGKRKRVGKVKAMFALEDGEKKGVADSAEEVDSLGNEVRGQEDSSRGDLPAETDFCIGKEDGIINIKETVLAQEMEEKEEMVLDTASAEVGSSDDGGAATEHAEEIMERVEDGTGGLSGTHDKQGDDELEGESHDRENVDMTELNEEPAKLDEEPVESRQGKKVDEKIQSSANTMGLSSIKGGRRCGLCGGGTDGKPPKKLMSETADSENEAYNCSSPSEEPNYDILDGFGDGPDWLGRLLGPVNDRYGIAGIWVHQNCAVWSPEVYFAGLGCLKNVRAALCRGRALKCTRCGRPGATIGCRVDRCPKTYHLPCARANGCIFDHRKFLIACTDHRHFFQPHGVKNSNWLKRMRAKKVKLEYRKLSNDVSRKDIEAEEKWLENCGEDEEFLKRESRRLHRDLLRISPVYIGGGSTDDGNMFEGWESVAGLQDVIRCMKEVVILPLLYPEFFDNLGLTPPRGVLLHGYPGTGKTLVVRALIGACARGDKRIAYFARKGADCLGKYVGDAERQLRLLFQVAEKCQPSIIFFDEIDGLAPRRTKQQDQTHSSVVSTLLTLLDGLKSRGSVVVIGATNRPDAVDPALRRPGRFDREIYFPLPSLEDRAEILSLHTKKWPKPVSGSLLKFIARKTAGFAGADLQALCTQAVIIALKRNFPLQEILSTAGKNSSGGERVSLPSVMVEERDWLEALSCSSPPCSRREAGIAANDIVSSPLPTHLYPCFLEPLSLFLVSLHLHENLCLPPPLSRAASRVKSVIFSAMEKRQWPVDRWRTHLHDFIQDSKFVKDIERGLLSTGLLNGESSSVENDAFGHDSEYNFLQSVPSLTLNRGTRSFTSRNTSFALRRNSGYRLLISGSPGSGQRHLASCLLHCYIGNVEVQKIDLATVSQEGHGDAVQGITQILMKCASAGSSVVFMPRIDLWAVETHCDVTNEDDVTNEEGRSKNMEMETDVRESHSEEMAGNKGLEQSTSQAWNSFIEQAESICVNTSLIVLATSEIAVAELPYRIRQFFRGDVQRRCQSSHSENALPRFSINLGVDIDFDMVIKRSVAKLSSNMVEHFVQLVHQKTLLHATSKYGNSDCSTKHIPNGGLAGEGELDPIAQRSDDSSVKASQIANKRNLKGKSSLMLAISAFGYQILRYPHFAELCWVSSKLKEGPVADIRGPWKGWPFNSCIIRPYGATEETVIASSPGNVKSEEKYGLVRGLVAIGLSAYRGIYESAKEVSFEIRQVLEILVGQISMKIQAGKDMYDYFRILSQVSYLEDLVNSWAYSLQSLESDAQVTISKATPTLTTVSAPNQNTNHDMLQTEELEPHVSGKVASEEEVVKGNGPGAGVENLDIPDLNKENGDCVRSGSLERLGTLDGGHQILGNSAVAEHPLSPVAAGKLVGDNGKDAPCPDAEPSGAYPAKALDTMGILPKDGPCTSGSLKEMEIISTSCAASSNKDDIVGNNPSSATDSGDKCFYRCCSECLSSLHDLMRKLLLGKWGLNRNEWTVEDIHDAVASLSVDLFSELRKGCFISNSSNLFGETDDGSLDSKGCSCSSLASNPNFPVECTCHSVDGHRDAEGSGSREGQCGLNVEFIVRNGVLEPGDTGKDVDFQCKFERLCLCSLTKLAVFTKPKNSDTL